MSARSAGTDDPLTDYKRHMGRLVAGIEQIPTARQRRKWLRREKWSPLLFKYMSLNPKQPERVGYLRDIVVGSTLHLSSPVDFNDPFDCRLSQRFEGTEEQRLDGLVRLSRRVRAHLRDAEHLDWARSVLHNASKNLFPGNVRPMPAAGVCCFAGDARHILMWAHYADAHRGVCLIFDRVRSVDPLVATIRVNYQDRFQSVNYAQHSDAAIEALHRAAALSKAAVWAYEREERIVLMDAPNKRLKFDPSALRGLILGASADEVTEAAVQELLRERAGAGLPSIRTYRAHVSTNAHLVRIYRSGKAAGRLDVPACRLAGHTAS